jgi:ATP-dependent RNA/DNA helicase IGHMBP2
LTPFFFLFKSTSIVNDVRKDIEASRKVLGGRGKSKIDAATRREKRSELKALCKEARVREKAVVEKIIKRSNVILCTCIGASSHLLKSYEFDMVVVDEAAQGIEAACWIPLLLGRKCVLAGDHCQLPPTVKSDEAAKRGLAVTLFERVILDQRFAPVVKLLDTQYRMNALISDWASNGE